MSRKTRDIDISSKFKSTAERKIANNLLEKYLSDYTIETIADKNTLQEIIYLEVLQIRLQDKLNELYDKDSKALPLNIIEIIHKNSDSIVKLKNTLGLNKSKEKQTAYDVLEHAKKRWKIWRDNNQVSRTRKCPHCQKFILFKIRPENWELQKHPYFKDNLVYNKHLFNNINRTILINRDFIANVLETSPDYIDWVISKIKQNQTIEGQTNGKKEETLQKELDNGPDDRESGIAA